MRDVAALQPDLPGGDAQRRGQQAEDGQHRDALAGPGFTDHAEDLVAPHLEADVLDQARRRRAAGDLDRQATDAQNWFVIHQRVTRDTSPNSSLSDV